MYDAFLSFRGGDTRRNFTCHLHKALESKGVKTFIDNDLERGEEISSALLQTIEASRMSVIIFSPNYASSRWCLDELVHIMECKDSQGQLVFPVFYDVDPSEVRSQTGAFGEEFLKVKERFKEDVRRTKSWSDSLTAAANLSGWHSSNCSRNDVELIDEVVCGITNKLRPIPFCVSSDLVGMDSHMKELVRLLSLESADVSFVGIWGLAGIGKTTVAEVLLSKIFDQFDEWCFLPKISSSNDGLLHQRKRLFVELLHDENLRIEMLHALPTSVLNRLKRKRVLVVLDDVSGSFQLDDLAREDWFGPGSRVVVTGRDKEVLRYRCSKIYEVEGLNHDDALQLFSMKAFKQLHPSTHFTKLSDRALNYAKGFPLALIILGSQLYKRSAEEWEGVLHKLKQSPLPGVIKILRTSFDELNQMEKDIFLDIACFFQGYSREWVECILDGEHGISTRYVITRLVEKSLVTAALTGIQMHDLLQEMGQDIAQDSRLVNSRAICEVLEDEGKAKAIEGIVFDMCKLENAQLSHVAFSLMPNLRFLKIYRPSLRLERDRSEESMWKSGLQRFHQFLPMMISAYLEKIVGSIEFQRKQIQFLSRRLSVFHWEEYPYRSLPTNFFMENIVDINMEGSKVEKLWEGNECLPRLKWLNLSDCMNLKRLPDLSAALCLEEIILKNCKSLMEIPSSIQCLHKLQCIDFDGCENLRSCPSLVRLKSLMFLRLRKCSNLEIFPATTPSKHHRIYPNLFQLEIKECKWLESLSSSICQMKWLADLYLNGCSNLEKLPALDGLRSLTTLCLSETSIRKIPDLVSLSSLVCLMVNNCNRLQGLPELPSQLREVEAINCMLLETSGSTSRLTSPQLRDKYGGWSYYYCSFNFFNCVNLEESTLDNFTRDALLRIKGIANMQHNEVTLYTIRVIFPRSEIPEWFSHQCPGSSIDFEVKQSNPSSFNSGFLDFAFSVVLERVPDFAFYFIDVTCKCCFKGPNGDPKAEVEITKTFHFFNGSVSDHVLLWYSNDSHNLSGWLIQNHCSVNEASFQFEAKLGGNKNTKVVEVKRCGVHLVFAGNELFQATNSDQAMEMRSNSSRKRRGHSLSKYKKRGPRFKRFKYFYEPVRLPDQIYNTQLSITEAITYTNVNLFPS